MANVLEIAGYELVRLFGTRRGLVAIVAYLLIWLLVLRYAIYPASQLLASGGENMPMLSLLIGGLISLLSLDGVTDWLTAEVAVYWLFSLWMWPLFSVLLTADQSASDRGRGTLRYLHLRATRTGIFFGRFVGQMLIQALLLGVSLVSTLAITLYRDAALLGQGTEDVIIVLVNMLLVIMPYTAMMALVSILARSARQATVYAVIVWIAALFLVSWLKSRFPTLAVLEWVLPGAQVGALLQLQWWDTLSLAAIPLIQSMVLLLAGWLVMQRVDL